MTEREIFDWLIAGWLVIAAAVFIILFFVAAPYGRHIRRGWGLTLNNKLGWIIMESTSAILFAVFFFLGDHRSSAAAVAFLLMWEAHYIHRAFIYPLMLKGFSKKIPLLIVLFGLVFNTGNVYLNGRWLFSLSGGYADAWLRDPRFIAGTLLFVAGFIINRQADTVLRALRTNGETGYSIPHGGFYRWVSSPNYLGELAIWTGWAIATWSLPGLTFAIWTAANLVPRARANHRWYRETFPDYPAERCALIPGVW